MQRADSLSPSPSAIRAHTLATMARGRRGEGGGEGQPRAPTCQRGASMKSAARDRKLSGEGSSPVAAPHPNPLPASGERGPGVTRGERRVHDLTTHHLTI